MRTQTMKLPVAAFAVSMALALGACGGNASTTSAATSDEATSAAASATDASSAEATSADATSAAAATATTMTHAEYEAAAIDDPVTVETYVQATQSYYEDEQTITIYAQDPDGAYFIYGAHCTAEDAAKLVPGTKIKVSGYKGEWSGEVEIVDGTFEIVDGDSFVAEPTDVTALLGTDELTKHMNEKVVFKGLTVAPSTGADGSEVAFTYNADGSGAQGDDVFFKATDAAGEAYTFTLESYLTDKDSDAYKAAEALKVGDKVDIDAFLYWYEGANPHVTGITVL